MFLYVNIMFNDILFFACSIQINHFIFPWKNSFRTIHQMQVQQSSLQNNRDISDMMGTYTSSAHSSRNNTPLTQTPVGSPNTIRQNSLRRTWFPPDVVSSFDQFKPSNNTKMSNRCLSRENSHNSSSENEATSFQNSKVCDILVEHSSPQQQQQQQQQHRTMNYRISDNDRLIGKKTFDESF